MTPVPATMEAIPRLDEAGPSRVYTYTFAVGEGRTARTKWGEVGNEQ
jgi:hypothetical protein